jgi:cytoskeletal protein RodZ
MTRPQPKKAQSDGTARLVYIGGAILVVALLAFSLTRMFRTPAPAASVAATPSTPLPPSPAPAEATPQTTETNASPAASLPPMQSARGGAPAAVPPQITPPLEEREPTAAEVKDVPRTKPEDVLSAFENKSATIIDVRDKDSYLEGHVPGALHIPLAYIAGEVPYLPKNKPIITYCT